MFCFIFYALFLCCNALIHLGCILGWHVKKECAWAPVPWKAEPEEKLAYWRFAGRGVPGHQEWEKENEEVKRGKRKENQRWCFVTRTAPVSEENTALFQMQDVREAEADSADLWVQCGRGWGGERNWSVSSPSPFFWWSRFVLQSCIMQTFQAAAGKSGLHGLSEVLRGC